MDIKKQISTAFFCLNVLFFTAFFSFAEETPTIAIEEARFAIEKARLAGAEQKAVDDLAAAKSWLARAQKEYEGTKSFLGRLSTEKSRKIKEEEIIYLANMAKLKAMIAENKSKKYEVSKELQGTLKSLQDYQNAVEVLKKKLAEAEKARMLQEKMEAEKKALEEAKRQAVALEEEKKRQLLEAQRKAQELEMLRQKELEEARIREAQRAAEREKELAEAKLKAEQLAWQKAKEEAERKAREKQLAALQEKAAALEREKVMLAEAGKINWATVKSTGKEIIITILAANLFTPATELKPSGKEILDQVGKFLAAYPDYHVIVRGHTDSVGNIALNQALSEKRANKVREYLVAYQNIQPTRITAEGLGPSQPMASNDTEAGRMLNRRVEIVMITEK